MKDVGVSNLNVGLRNFVNRGCILGKINAFVESFFSVNCVAAGFDWKNSLLDV